MRRSVLTGVVGAFASAAICFGIGAASAADYYQDKRITLYVAASPGGGYAIYARSLARHWVRHIPGQPDIVIRHKQGANGVIALNYLAEVAKRDGTEILASYREASSTTPLFASDDERKSIRYKPEKLSWIGSMNGWYGTCVAWHESGIKSFDDMRKGMIVGGIHFGSMSDMAPRFMNNLFDTNVQVVTGYPAGTAINLAMERGEVQGRCGWSIDSIKSTKAEWLDGGRIKVIVQHALKPYPGLEDVPLVVDFAKSQRERDIIKLILLPAGMGRPYVGPPEMDREALKALRTSFTATLNDGQFKAEAKKSKLDIVPATGEEVEDVVNQIFSSPPELVAATIDVLNSTTKTKVTKAVLPDFTHKAKIEGIKREGRSISFSADGQKFGVSIGGKTPVTIAGKTAKRSAIAVGMTCTIKHQGAGSRAKSVACD